MGACGVLRPHPGSWKECGNHFAMSAVGSDMGAGLAICLCPVIVGHFGNQALPLSILSFPALNRRTLRGWWGWGGLNLEAWALQPPFCHGSQSTYPQDGEALGGWGTSRDIWPPRPLPKVAPLPHSDIGITWLPTPCSLRTSLFSLLPLGKPP